MYSVKNLAQDDQSLSHWRHSLYSKSQEDFSKLLVLGSIYEVGAQQQILGISWCSSN